RSFWANCSLSQLHRNLASRILQIKICLTFSPNPANAFIIETMTSLNVNTFWHSFLKLFANRAVECNGQNIKIRLFLSKAETRLYQTSSFARSCYGLNCSMTRAV